MKSKRVFWLLAGDINTGSSRIHGYNVHNELLNQGIYSSILFNGFKKLTRKLKIKIFFTLGKGDLLIIQKRKEIELLKLLILLKLKGVEIAFVDCDIPLCDSKLVNYFDYIICSSQNLKDLYTSQYPLKNVIYIPDAIEYFEIKEKIKINKKAVYYGWLTDSRMKTIQNIKQKLNNCDWDLKIMSNKDYVDIPWYDWSSLKTYKIISQFTVSIIPIDCGESSKYKSSNRVLQSMAIGNVVVCGNLNAYREVVVNGYNGFICSSDDEWEKVMEDLSNSDLIDKIVNRGYEVAKEYTMDKIILKWMSSLGLHN